MPSLEAWRNLKVALKPYAGSKGDERMQLNEPFSRLLGKPITSFPTDLEYGCFIWAGDSHVHKWAAVTANRFGCSLPLKASTRSIPEGSKGQLSIKLGKDTYQHFDLARSFLVSPWEWLDDEKKWPVSALASLKSLAQNDLVSGAQYATVMHKFRAMPAWPVVIGRVCSDGTLVDALRCAFSLEPPIRLDTLEQGAVIDQQWVATLDGIADEALRQHLSTYYLNNESARCYGAKWSSSPCMVSALSQFPGFKLIQGWDFGEGEAGVGVFQLPAEATEFIE